MRIIIDREAIVPRGRRFEHNGRAVTATQAELIFQEWYLSEASIGLVAEEERTALNAQALFAVVAGNVEASHAMPRALELFEFAGLRIIRW